MTQPRTPPDAFIRTHTRWLPVDHVPEISLYLADEATALWQKTEDDLDIIGLPPPFWAFAWAGGQALARYILDHPEVVAGKRVLDIGSGSGLIAIAAAKCGATHVCANDIDEFSLAAIALNAIGNNVTLDIAGGDICGRDDAFDVILAGDISYEHDMAERLTLWLSQLAARGAHVLIGDPGRSYLAKLQLEAIAEYEIPVNHTLEDTHVKTTRIWRFRARS